MPRPPALLLPLALCSFAWGQTTAVSPAQAPGRDVVPSALQPRSQGSDLSGYVPRTPGEELAWAGYIETRGRRRAHLQAIERTGVGLYYGDHSGFQTMTPEERQAWLAERATAGTEPPAPRSSSCIGWSLEVIGAAYQRVGRAADFARIQQRVVAANGLGTVLARELIRDGWQAVYWSPDSRTPEDGDNEHPFTARIARTKHTYYRLPIVDLVVDYRPSAGSATQQDTRGLEKLARVPFWFGIARGGMHTFVGFQTTISEFHWDQQPDSPRAIEENPLADGRRWRWLSGIIVVPPGTWPRS